MTTTSNTTARTATDIRHNIDSIRIAAFGMNVPVNAGQQARIDQLENELAELEGTKCHGHTPHHGSDLHTCTEFCTINWCCR